MSNDRYISILNEIRKHGGEIDSGKPDDKVLIIDGLNTFIRVFSVIPTLNDDGIHVGGIVGFLKSVGYAIKMLNPTRCIVVFDGKGGSVRRRKLYPEYKKKRKTKIRLNRANDFSSVDDEQKSMFMQVQRSVEYLEQLPITILSIDNIEADDTIAYISTNVLPKSDIIIMSTDKDFLQLVSDRISVWSPTKKKLYNPELVKEEYGVTPNNLLMCRIFDGDQSDNIKGVLGIGTKTLVKNFPAMKDGSYYSVEDIIKTAVAKQDTESGNFYKTILEQRDTMFLNRRLMQLHEVDISQHQKLKILDTVNKPISKLVKHKFQTMFMDDKLYSTLPNLNSWLATSFNKLNNMAEKSYGKKT
jgi:DNA polymerase-1|tara:strand:- start:2757 stop:3827 length:1071 start_codon:yes stop_codon:yes gene_type:complete